MGSRRIRAVAVALAAVVLAGSTAAATAVPGIGKGPKPLDPCAPVLACGTDLEWAIALERKVDDNFVHGQVVEIDYRTTERLPGDVRDVGAWGDSGLWTGTYLASQSFRYALASKYADHKRLDAEQRAFWAAQRAEALARVQEMVAKYHLLVNIGADWTEELNPQLRPEDTYSPASFGGGVIEGQAGMLMRACAPADAPPEKDMSRNRRVFEITWSVDGRTYLCETAPSRDTYAGTTFGLLTAFDLVARDVPGMRAQIRDDILTLADFLVRHGWNFPRPHGNVSAPPTGHDFDNFVSPLFVYVPLARLNMSQAARHVANSAGGVAQQAQWNAVWAEELATQGPMLAASMEVDSVQPNEGYYKFNLHHLTGYNLVRLERDPAVRTLFKQALGVMDRTTRDDINAHFEAITFALTGERDRLSDAVTHLREWRDYRTRIDAGGATTNSCTEVECVKRDQYDVIVENGDDDLDVTVPANPTTTAERARYPLPVAKRPPTDFLWQRPPTQLNGSTSATHQAPGVDYLLPYWMLRYHTELAEPALDPFPPYPGPAHE